MNHHDNRFSRDSTMPKHEKVFRPIRPSEVSASSRDWRRYKEQLRAWKNDRLKKKLDAEQADDTERQTSILSNTAPNLVDKGRLYTLSIALPASIIRNAQSKELQTYLAGQIGRAACIFNIDEIIVFDDDEKNKDIDNNPFSASEQLIRLLEYLEW